MQPLSERGAECRHDRASVRPEPDPYNIARYSRPLVGLRAVGQANCKNEEPNKPVNE